MNLPANLDAMSPDELRPLAAQLMAQVGENERELRYRQTRIDQLTHEIATLRRLHFGKRSEQLNVEQMSLLNEAIDADLAALEIELEQLQSNTPGDKPRQQPKRAPLPAHLPRTDIHHEPDDITCACGCQRVRIGEDISEKLDYTPGVFTVERHIRGKWACKACETLIQAPVPPQAWIANAKNRTHLLIDGKAATASCSAAKSVMTHETGYATPKRIERQPPHARLASSSLNAPSCRCSMSARTSGSARRAAWRDDFGKAAHASSISPDRCSPIAASNTQA